MASWREAVVDLNHLIKKMVIPSVRLDIDNKLLNLSEAYTKQARDITNDWVLDVADKLQQESYRGATLGLASGWDVIPATRRRNTLDLRVVIVNREPSAIFRISGRRPGAMPPIEPLTDWVIAKGIESDRRRAKGISFAIAKKIAAAGTTRHRTQDNFVGINSDGSLKPNSPIYDYRDELVERLSGITI